MKKLFPILLFSLLAFVSCSDDDDKSIPVDNAVVEFINAKYNGAKIRHAEYDGNGLIEVEILHDSRLKDVYFDKDNKCTSYLPPQSLLAAENRLRARSYKDRHP